VEPTTEQAYKRRIAELEAEVADLQALVAELRAQVARLSEQVAKLAKNSSNSSKPPSSDIVKPPKPKPKGKRKNERRKIGGQKGHPKHDRQPFAVEDRREQLTRHRHLGYLEDHISRVGHDLRTDLDQLLPQRGQRPMPRRPRQRQPPQEVTQIVREREQLKPNLVVPEVPARQPRPLDRILAFFDPLLRRAATIVELDHLPRPAGHVGHDEPGTRKQLARVPLDLGHHAAGMVPTLRLIREVRVEHLGLV
jgi:uncharacterized coiled-coil protein SlyX